MNKRQLEVQKALADNEAEVIKQLKQIYARASKDCENKIRDLSARTDMENLKSIVWQKQYQEALKKQIDGVLDKLNAESFTTIADYLTDCYENGFFGALYDLQGQGIPLILPINQEEVVQAIQIDSKISKGLYQRMGEDTEQLKKSIRLEVSRGVSNGSSWNTIASKIAFGMNSPFMKAYNRAIGITRTEGHRVQQESTLHCQQRAKAKGADVVKQWDSTLDSVTRPTHRELDGQIREIDEPFEVEGKKAMYPGAFGDPSEDCNCRCCLLQRAKWALSGEEYYTKFSGGKNELVRIEAKTYNEFKQKADEIIKVAKEEVEVHLVGKINRGIYKCIADDIVTDEVIITDERIRHIMERHPNDYERYYGYLKEIVEHPQYIVETSKPYTALILSEFADGEEQFKTVLRLTTARDNPNFKNSIITFMRINDREWKRMLKNKRILYKRE